MLADFPRELVTDVGENLDYQQRKERGICTRPGCPNPACEDSLLCVKHRDRAARAQRRHRRRQRKAREIAEKKWARQRRCLGCGDKRLKGHEHCAKCLVRFDRVEKLIRNHERNPKADRIAANTSIDRDGRSRFHGQGRRGQPKRGAIDAKDLGYALDALGRGIKGLAFVDALAADPLTKAQRHEAKTEALAQLDQAQRFIDDVLERHGYFGKVDPADKPARR